MKTLRDLDLSPAFPPSNDTQGIPQHVHDAPTVPIRVARFPNSPYSDMERCACGAAMDNVDPSDIRVIYSKRLGRLRIVWCPMCPRNL